jgi:glycosyltransferase involved in cell wall biosynthesis
MSILEAAASGLPIISTDVNDIPYLVKHGTNGFLVHPGDSDTLGRHINSLLNDENMRQAMGAASRKIAEESFSYNRMALQTLELYKKVISRS